MICEKSRTVVLEILVNDVVVQTKEWTHLTYGKVTQTISGTVRQFFEKGDEIKIRVRPLLEDGQYRVKKNQSDISIKRLNNG